MICPKGCATNLMITDRQGVEIDFCPICRGVWLDRGELDKILDRSSSEPVRSEPAYAGRVTPDHDDWDDDDRRYGRKKKKNFLREIFDFD